MPYLAAHTVFAQAQFDSPVPQYWGCSGWEGPPRVGKAEPPAVRGSAQVIAAMDCYLPDTWERLESIAD